MSKNIVCLKFQIPSFKLTNLKPATPNQPVENTGLEPVTSWLQTRCSSQLS